MNCPHTPSRQSAMAHILWENSKRIFDKTGKRQEQLYDAFKGIKYSEYNDGQDNAEWGIHHDRSRQYGLAMNVPLSGLSKIEADVHVRKIMKDALELGKTLRKGNCLPCASEYLLPDNHPHVKRCFERYKDSKAQPEMKGWRQKIEFFCLDKGIIFSELVPSSDLINNDWFNAFVERDQLTILALEKAYPDLTAVEISQSVERCTVKTDGRLPVMLPTGKVWLNMTKGKKKIRRLLTGYESMLSQGMPQKVLEKILEIDPTISDALLESLAGNAFTALVPVAITLSILVNLTQHQRTMLRDPSAIGASTENEDEPDYELNNMFGFVSGTSGDLEKNVDSGDLEQDVDFGNLEQDVDFGDLD